MRRPSRRLTLGSLVLAAPAGAEVAITSGIAPGMPAYSSGTRVQCNTVPAVSEV